MGFLCCQVKSAGCGSGLEHVDRLDENAGRSSESLRKKARQEPHDNIPGPSRRSSDQHQNECLAKILKFRQMMGQHYFEMLSALLSPQAYQVQMNKVAKVFGLFNVDHRCFITSLEAVDQRNSCPEHIAFIFRSLKPQDRKQKGVKVLYKCSRFYINFFCKSHRKALTYFLMFVVFIQYKNHLV